MLRGRTRVMNACLRCRKQKIKCSGVPPCRTCRSRGLKCDFGAEDKQVLISERELFDLRMRSNQRENDASDEGRWCGYREYTEDRSTTEVHGDGDVTNGDQDQAVGPIAGPSGSGNETMERNEDVERGVDSNPLAPGQPAYVQEVSGRLRYLGHSSTYAFTQQVLHMLSQSPPSNPSPEILLGSDGLGYKAETIRLTHLVEQDVSRLPSKGTALHYLQSLRFRTQPLFYLFDDVDFMERLQRFYADAYEYAQANPLWYAHYLVLMAFGKALDPHEQFKTRPTALVPEHLTRALRLLPDMTFLTDHPVDATEFFVSIALFLQSIDHRQAAILYLGLALRMAHLYALHRNFQECIVGHRSYQRCRRLWWTVYALNQRLTSNIGLPNFIVDGDITAEPPAMSASNEDDQASAIHVKICRLLGLSISRVYGSFGRDRRSFVSTTQAILRGAASIAAEVQTYSESCFGEISRVAAHLELAYHQCVIVTCRPALFGLLKIRSETLPSPCSASPSPAMTGLIQVCVDSATHSAQILDQLRQNNLLDTFLPFDLDCGFSAAFVLLIAAYVHPKVPSRTASVQQVKEAIETIAARGNEQGRLRKLEIEQLEMMLSQQTQVSPQNPYSHILKPNLGPAVGSFERGGMQTIEFDSLFFEDFEFGNELTGTQMRDLAEALGAGDFGPMTE